MQCVMRALLLVVHFQMIQKIAKLMDLKNTQKFEGSDIKSHRIKIFTHNWVSFISDCFALSKALTY